MGHVDAYEYIKTVMQRSLWTQCFTVHKNLIVKTMKGGEI